MSVGQEFAQIVPVASQCKEPAKLRNCRYEQLSVGGLRRVSNDMTQKDTCLHGTSFFCDAESGSAHSFTQGICLLSSIDSRGRSLDDRVGLPQKCFA